MSWLARSLANSLKFEDQIDDESDYNGGDQQSAKCKREETRQSESSDEASGRGVKDDLSQLTKTLTRQIWGVASFLAPPPSSDRPDQPDRSDRAEDLVESSSSRSDRERLETNSSVSEWNRWESEDRSVNGEDVDQEMADAAGIAGIRSDFAEIGGKFRTGFSRLSSNKAVSEISKIASTFLPFGAEEDEEVEEEESGEKHAAESAVGVTDEVLAFARNIAMHPETWLDFPLADEEESDDFDLSNAQQEHALAVERHAPRLAALRIELCPSYMSEGCFWMIYFVLLHSRLNKHDAELLSTPQVLPFPSPIFGNLLIVRIFQLHSIVMQIVEARARLMQDIQKRPIPEPEWNKSSFQSREITTPLNEERIYSSPYCPAKTSTVLEPFSDIETDKHPVICSETQFIDKTVVKEEATINKDSEGNSAYKQPDYDYDEYGDEWLEDESTEVGGFSVTTIPIGNEEDVSFSDLEDDDDTDIHKSSKTVSQGPNSSTTKDKDSRDWVELSRSPAGSAKDIQIYKEPKHGNDNAENKESNEWLNLDDIDVA
ncbi:hypothetical protein Sjap_022643 [Stephania japonica]|uniref:BSD domain-containing protein n=1 Tax=Stephania japonica TaxID=461633 RepID=A0AAP0EP97_9MAGN